MTTPPHPPEPQGESGLVIDSKNYRSMFYGILNRDGAFWTPLAFQSEAEAGLHLTHFWRGDWSERDFKIVPVRIQLTALSS